MAEFEISTGAGEQEDGTADGSFAGSDADKPGVAVFRGKEIKDLQLDIWQREVIDYEGNICLRSGRQCGKSTVIAIKVGEYSINNSKKSVMVISATERQAYLLFSKIYSYIYDNYRKWIKKGKDRPTKSEIRLTNGTIIRCLPTGLDGSGIRGYTVDLLVADEAAHIPEDVWPAVTPMLATTKGHIILLSTPLGSDNYFYNCYHNPQFKTWHISSENCSRITKEFLDYEKMRMTRLHYKQEYQGEFTEYLRQLFPDSLIKACMISDGEPNITEGYYMGVDIARMGGDECTFEIGRRVGDSMIHVESFVTENILIPDTINKILELNRKYRFNNIYIDTGGMGVAVFDFLLRNDETRSKVVSIDNARRIVERAKFDKEPRKSKLQKEHLYMNLKRLMEQNKISLLKDENIFFSLKSVQCEVDETTKELKIFGNYTHIAEGLIRMAWPMSEKNISSWVYAF